jgi:hypothetical protein
MVLALLARFPKLRPEGSRPVVPVVRRPAYPALAADFELLDEEVTPAFAEYDTEALRGQNRYRRQQIGIMLGSALMSGFGGAQAVFPGQRWPGLAVGVVGIALAASSRLAQEGSAHVDYLDARLKAERLRGLYFRYLSATDRYTGEDRVSELRRAVLTIREGREPQ